VVCVLATCVAAPLHAQILSTRLPILQAEERRAVTPADLALIRKAIRSTDAPTARLAIRAAGRLERRALVADLLPALTFELPEVRAEAATAIGASFGSPGTPAQPIAPPEKPAKPVAPGVAVTTAATLTTLGAHLQTEPDSSVRAALAETIGRLPYGTAAEVARAERLLVDLANDAKSFTDRLGAVKALELLSRLRGTLQPLGPEALRALRGVLGLDAPPASTVSVAPRPPQPTASAGVREAHVARDARLRRLALQALTNADRVEDDVLSQAERDGDPQVRRLAMRAAAFVRSRPSSAVKIISRGLVDAEPMVRVEAVRGLAILAPGAASCQTLLGASADGDARVASLVIDQLAACGQVADAVTFLERAATDTSAQNAARGWLRAGHALVALAAVAPDRAGMAISGFASASQWPFRLCAVRAAVVLRDRPMLTRLAGDAQDDVAAAARSGIASIWGESAVPASSVRQSQPLPSALALADLRRLAAPRARVSVKGVGTFDVALFTLEAPATVLQFVHLAQAGYYDGRGFQPWPPTVMAPALRAGSALDGAFARSELGSWPHVRGTLGLKTAAPEGSDPQIFINLVDNPSFDYEHTVFAQVLNGMDVVDRIAEGDVIEKVEILAGS
jgi:peptidyl-prolyl cis-trans isomerase B (cyclophilin B)